MIWLPGILVFLLLIAGWLLVSPLLILLDTRVPQAAIRWRHVGNAQIWYDQGWWLSLQIPFYRKTIRLNSIKSKPGRIKSPSENERLKKRTKTKHLFKKIVRVMKTFRVIEWKLAVDTGNYERNGEIYPLNFLPYTARHIFINFSDENYLVLRIRNYPWKILYHFLR